MTLQLQSTNDHSCWRPVAGLIFGLHAAKLLRAPLSHLMVMPAGSTAEWFLTDDKVGWPGWQRRSQTRASDCYPGIL